MTVDLDWTAPIWVTDHALERARLRLDGPVERIDVRGEIRTAIVAGRVSAYQPRWTGGDRHDGRHLYLWDRDELRCWVVYPTIEGLHVKTMIVSNVARSVSAETRHLRHGFVRLPR